VRAWWLTHVQTMDQAFAAFLKQPAPAPAEARPKAFPGVE
jgi:hypothetical protein